MFTSRLLTFLILQAAFALSPSPARANLESFRNTLRPPCASNLQKLFKERLLPLLEAKAADTAPSTEHKNLLDLVSFRARKAQKERLRTVLHEDMKRSLLVLNSLHQFAAPPLRLDAFAHNFFEEDEDYIAVLEYFLEREWVIIEGLDSRMPVHHLGGSIRINPAKQTYLMILADQLTRNPNFELPGLR